MADAFSKFEAACKVASKNAGDVTTADLAALAGADAIATAVQDLNRQLISSTEALVETIWDFLEFDGDPDDEEEYDDVGPSD